MTGPSWPRPQVIRNLAAQGPCIIVGRGADYILRDLPQVINVFLYADPADKLQYAMDTYGDTREQAARRVRHSDAARESYYHYLTKKKWGDLKKLPSHPEHQSCGQTGLCRTHPSVRPPGYGSGEGDPVKNSQPQHPNRCCGCLFL